MFTLHLAGIFRRCFFADVGRASTWWVIVLNMGQRVVGIVVDGASDAGVHPQHRRDYVLILLEIEKFVASGNMGLTAEADYLNENHDE